MVNEENTDIQSEISRRSASKMLMMATVAGWGLTTTTRDVSAASATMSNQHLSVDVRNSGMFQIRNADGQQLIYPDARSSGLTVQVDGTNYVVGTFPGTNMGNYRVQDTQFSEETTVARTEWSLPEDVRVAQQISLAGEAARFRLSVENRSNQPREIRVRYLHDYQVGPQDGAPIFINGDVLTHERRFENPTFSSWQTYDQLPDPSLTGEGTITTPPTKIEFVAWEDASESGYEYDGFDSNKEFYTPGQTQSPASDSAGLLYYDLGAVSQGESETIVTSYGVGPPASADISGLEQALSNYRDAVTGYLDTVIEAKAKGYAAQYLRDEPDAAYGIPRDDRSGVFRNSIVRFFEVRAGAEGKEQFDPGYFDDIRALERTIPDNLSESEYEKMAQFLNSMFDAVPRGDPNLIKEETRQTFRQYLLGEGEGQQETLTIGGQTLGEIRDQFVQDFNQQRQQFIETCHNDEIDPSVISTLASRIRTKTNKINQAGNKWAESYRAVIDAAIEGEQMMSKAEVMSTGGAVGSAAGTAIGAVGGLLLAGPTGEEPILMAIGGGIGGVVGSGVGMVVAPVVTGAGEKGNQWSREFAGTETWKAITTFELQWLYHLKRAPDRVLPRALADYAGDDVAGRATTVPETLFDAGCADAPELVDLDIKIDGIDVPAVSEEQKLADSTLAKTDGKVTLRNPQSNNQAIKPTFHRNDCTVAAHSTAETVQRGWLLLPSRQELPDIQPGNSADIGFTVVTPLRSNADYSLSLLVSASPLSTTTRQATAVVTNTMGTADAVSTNQLSDGLIRQGESNTTSPTVDGASQASFDLVYGGSDLDLHLYAGDDNHVGRNYENGKYENTIPTAAGSGPDQGTGYESIEVTEASGTYETEVIAVSTPDGGSGYMMTSARSGPLPPSMRVLESEVDISVDPGETTETTLTVRETAGDQALSDISAESTTLSRDGGSDSIEDVSVNPTTTTVPAGDRGAVELTVSAPQNATPGSYDGTVTVADSRRSLDLSAGVIVRGQRTEDGERQSEGSGQQSEDEALPNWWPYGVGGAAITGGSLVGYRYLASDSEDVRDP